MNLEETITEKINEYFSKHDEFVTTKKVIGITAYC